MNYCKAVIPDENKRRKFLQALSLAGGEPMVSGSEVYCTCSSDEIAEIFSYYSDYSIYSIWKGGE